MIKKKLFLLLAVFTVAALIVVPVNAVSSTPNLCADGSVVHPPSACPAPPQTDTCTNGRVVLKGGCPAGTEPIQPIILAVPTGGSTTGNCTTWDDACTLQRAIQRAKYFVDYHPNMITSLSIYAKEGTYKPDPSDPTKSFPLYNGIAIYGGFDGTDYDLTKRDVVNNPTILSGDLNGNDGPNFTNMGENSYHVVTGTDLNNFPASSTLLPAILDGFIISGGNAPDNGGGIKLYNSSPSLYRLFFKDNRSSYGGGGVYNSNNSNPRLEGITFYHNYAYEGGGGMYSHFSSPKLFNVTFSGNSTDNWGGGMTNYQSEALLINVTFSGNTTTQPSGYSGAMFTVMDGGPSEPGVWPTMINTIIADSVGGDCLGQFKIAYNNLIEDGGTACGLVNGVNGNIVGFDPELSPLAYNGGISQTHAISFTSKAKNAGTNSVYITALNNNVYCPTYDQNTTKRALSFLDPCDIGATEFTATSNLAATNAVRYVIPGGATSGDCSSWATACNLEYAMSYARVGDQIWVKMGNYVPSGSSRSASFRPKNGIKIYGGFNGTETSFEQRNPYSNYTVLSGDINGDDLTLNNKSDNVYHVVDISELDSTTVLDGFMITRGYADGTDWPDYNGGGIFNYGGNATLSRLYIFNNYASNGGGGMINDSVNSIYLTNVTFANNTTDGIGGGGLINWLSNNVIMTRSTFSGNIANNTGNGGAISNYGSSTTVAESTISGNYAFNGGGLYNNSGGTVFLRNTIIANSAGGDCVGSLDPASANNLISDTDSLSNCGLSSAPAAFSQSFVASTASDSNGNIIGVDPNLGPFADNGSGIPTFALLIGSPAVDAGAICPSLDQRGQLPQQDGNGDNIPACDIGAVELDSTNPQVVSIVRTGANPTTAASVDFEVAFSEGVTNVDADGSDFTLVTTGITGASITSVTQDTPYLYTVTVNTGTGGGTLKLNVSNTASIQDLTGNDISGLPFTTGEVYTKVVSVSSTFKSTAANDGWILESSETSNTGGTLNSAQTTFILGDDAADKQYRAILHFDTSALPDNAIITNMTLKIKQQGSVTGTSPFSFASLYVDMRNPAFGASALELTDFNFAAKKVKPAVFNPNPVSGWFSARFNTGGKLYVNRTGTTQLRLYFSVDDNNNNIADFIRFFSGNASADSRPKLLIQYQLP